MLKRLFTLWLIAAIACWNKQLSFGQSNSSVDSSRIVILNKLRDEINTTYGLVIAGRVNNGPCGRFAKAFYEEWNSRFKSKCTIAFIMSADNSVCSHVLIKLPDSSYFDGGNGIMSVTKLWRFRHSLNLFNEHIEEMKRFDLNLLDERSYGLTTSIFPLCPKYSDSITTALLRKHLGRIKEIPIEPASKKPLLTKQQKQILNGLHKEINNYYGTMNVARIDLGRSAHFVKTLHEQWNIRFPDKVKYAFVMWGKYDRRPLVKFTDGHYFDASSGILTEQEIKNRWMTNGEHLEVLDTYDSTLLEKRIYALDEGRYPRFPDYSDSLTAMLINKYLDQLKKEQ